MNKFKLQIIFALGTILASIILAIALLDFLAFRSESLELNKQVLRAKNMALEAEIVEKFESFRSVLNTLKLDNYQSGADQLSEKNTSQMAAIYSVLKNRINGVYLFDVDGVVYKRNGDKSSSNYKNRSYYRALFERGQDFYVSSPYTNKSNGKVSIAIAHKVDSKTALSITVHLDTFIKNLKNRDDLYIYTDNGTVIISPNADEIGKKVKDVRPEFEAFAADSPELRFSTNIQGQEKELSAFWGRLDINEWEYVSLSDTKEITAGASSQLMSSLIIGFISFIMAIVIVLLVINKLVLRPVGGEPEEIASLMKRMANGDLNLGLKATEQDSGIYKSLISLSAQLSDLISKSVAVSNSVSSSSAQLDSIMDKALTNMEAEETQVKRMAQTLIKLSDTSKQMIDKAQSAENETKVSQAKIENGQVTLDKNISLAREINTSVADTAKIVNELKDFSLEISTVVDVINGISEQTNLLALNAAIEAARAGDAGRGFAVVADEVRALASKTQESTVSILDIIEKLQNKSKVAHDNMHQNTKLIESSVELADSVKVAFDEISQATNQISSINSLVANASLQQNELTEEVTENTTQTSQLVNDNVSFINHTKSSTKELAELAISLNDNLDFFKIKG